MEFYLGALTLLTAGVQKTALDFAPRQQTDTHLSLASCSGAPDLQLMVDLSHREGAVDAREWDAVGERSKVGQSPAAARKLKNVLIRPGATRRGDGLSSGSRAEVGDGANRVRLGWRLLT